MQEPNKTIDPKERKKNILWVFFFVFIDVLGFSLILPLLPFYAKDFHTSPSVIGLMLTFNALTQMISAPVIGRLSDHYGRKPLLLVCIVGTVVGFVILGNAKTVFELFLSRIIDGLLGGNISLAQTYISDITPENERSKSFGIIGAAFGIGFILGPAMGGLLSVYGYHYPAYIAAIVSLINLFGVYFYLPESLPVEKRRPLFAKAEESKAKVDRENEAVKTISKTINLWLGLRFLYLFTFTLFETSFGFYNLERLGLSARHSSYLLTYVGIVYSFIQGGGVKMLTRRTTERALVLYGFIALSGALGCWALSQTVMQTLFVLFPVSLASGLLNTLINSEISKLVEQSHLGEMLGISASVGSLTRILAPISAGYLLDTFGSTAPGVFGMLVTATAIGLMVNRKLYM